MKALNKHCGFVLSVVLGIFIFLPALQAESFTPGQKPGEKDLEQMRAEIQANGWTFEVGYNPAMEYSLDKLVDCRMGNEPVRLSGPTASTIENTLIIKLPSYYGCVSTAVKNQTTVSSWPFASTDMFESVILLRDGVSVRLSELWLLNCNPYGWDSNDGWFASDIFFRDGAVLASNFPPGTLCSSAIISYQADTWHFCGNGYSVASTSAIKSAILNYGSVACLVYADSYFQAYTAGVFNNSNTGNVNHFVTLCGWNDTTGAWRLKNTWGTGWGESGYMWIVYGCHNVGWAANYLVY